MLQPVGTGVIAGLQFDGRFPLLAGLTRRHPERPFDRTALDDNELAVAAVSIAEYRVGIELADTVARAADRGPALTVVTSAVDVLEYTRGQPAPRRDQPLDCRPRSSSGHFTIPMQITPATVERRKFPVSTISAAAPRLPRPVGPRLDRIAARGREMTGSPKWVSSLIG
jgi:hypothetical protein